MPQGDIATPSKTRSHTIQGTVSSVGTELQTFLQSLSSGTVIHSINTVRAKNNQGLIVLIAYEIP